MKRKIVGILLIGIMFVMISASNGMTLFKTISGDIAPKSVVYSGNGLFFAQNMMYRHTITVYNREYKLIKTIPDSVRLSDFGYTQYVGMYKGSPVEAAFSHGGKYAWVSNYEMSGKGFTNPGNDKGGPEGNYDKSFIYKINTETLQIENVIMVGAVPKYVAVSPDNRYVLVTNWCSFDVSIIETQTDKVIKTIDIGRHPRGIAVSNDSKIAYIAVMGSSNVAVLNLEDFTLHFIKNVGAAPRHLNMSPDGKYLYVSCNGEGTIAKIDLDTEKVIKKVSTGSAPRSMILSDDGKKLYVVNYSSDSMSKLDTETMKVVQTVETKHHPIGITFDPETKQVWVSCYSGFILVFQD